MYSKLLLLAIVLFGHSPLFCQNPLTIVPPNYIQTIGFSPLPTGQGGNNINDPGSPFDYYDAGFLMDGSANCMADMQGNLRFFIVDGLIFDGQQGAYIDYAWCYMDTYNGTSTTYHVKQYQSSNYVGQETVIVPHPVNCNQYYIFSSIVTQNYLMKQFNPNEQVDPEPPTPTPDSSWVTLISSLPVYCLYDAATQQVLKRGVWYDDAAIALQNPIDGLSEAIFTTALTSNPNISNGDTPVTHLNWGEQTSVCGNLSLAASDLRPDGTRFVTCYLRNHLYIIQITASGDLRYWKRYETTPNLGALYVKESEMELIYENTTQNYLIAATNDRYGQNLLLFKLTSDMLSLVNLQEYAMPYSSSTGFYEISGLEFSPDKSKLYVTSDISFNVLNAPKLNYINLNQATLQHLPVNSSNNNLASLSSLENGLDGNMYIATATGVYRMTNPNNPSAAVISSSPVYSFPIHLSEVGVVPNLTVFGHRGYRLPDNVDGMNYNTHFFSDLSCCVSNNSFNKSSYTTNASTLPSWTGNNNNLEAIPNSNIATIRDELRIKKGTSLTITGMEIRFAPGAKLIIEAGDNQVSGGKLILNATTLTVDTRCSSDALWDGVEVQGIYNQPQGSIYGASKQGRLILTNNSIIEHARRGVLAGSFDNSSGFYNYNPSKTGGIVVAKNAVFRNNQRDVVFRKYISPNGQNNFSSFVNCQFLVTQTLKGNVQPINHVELHTIKNVYFGGCDFKHTSSHLRQGNGIYALNSIFNVKAQCTSQSAPCTNFDPNLFENLNQGIWVNAAGATSTFSSDRNVFINNLVGIRATNTNLATITRNQFKLYEASTQTTGLYLVNSTKYVVEENDFDIVASEPMPTAKTYGIVVNNSGVLPNSIYKNTFHNLYIGGQSESVNSNNDVTVPGSIGLVWKCNTFNKPIEKHDLTVINGRISYNQGLVNTGSALLANQYAASNIFSLANESAVLEHDLFLSNANPINYVYVSNATNIRPDSYTNSLVNIQQTTVNGSQIPYDFTNACPTRLGKGKDLLAFNLIGLKAELAANSPKLDLQAEIDRTVDDLVREVLLDTTQSRDFADLIPLLSAETNKVYKDLLINTYTLQNDFTSATNLLYSISNCERTQELNAVLIDLFNMQDDNHFLSQYPNHYEALQSLSNDMNFEKTANRAKVILATLNQFSLDENYEFYEANVVRNSALSATNSDVPYMVYPNPFENEITVIGNELTNRKIVIVDLSGTIVYQTTIDELSETVSLAGLSHGLYLLSIYDNENHVIQTNRIIKK